MKTLLMKTLLEREDIPSNFHSMSDEELMSHLITLDYKGKVVKTKCLEELLARAKEKGYNEGYETAQHDMGETA